MDFKVTGTRDGITATQMDIKVDGLSYDILERALNQAKEGRMHILGKITETIAEPRTDLKDHAPRIETMTIPKEFIGAVIGPGRKNHSRYAGRNRCSDHYRRNRWCRTIEIPERKNATKTRVRMIKGNRCCPRDRRGL